MLSESCLKDDFEQLLNHVDAGRWQVELIAPLEVRIVLGSERTPDQRYKARLLWTSYPHEAPSLKFLDLNTNTQTTAAWPNLPGFRPPSQDACWNWCAEGFALHPEWRTDPANRWDPKGNVLAFVVQQLQLLFDVHYVSRSR
jgi:hypothetical protein